MYKGKQNTFTPNILAFRGGGGGGGGGVGEVRNAVTNDRHM